MAETKVVVDCSLVGAPPQEYIDQIKQEALKALEAGDTEAAASILAEANAAQERLDKPAVQILELTKEEIKQREKDAEYAQELRIAQARGERDGRLSRSDWTQLPDSPLSEQQRKAWAKHRQALRDMSFDGTEPAWPKEPDE